MSKIKKVLIAVIIGSVLSIGTMMAWAALGDIWSIRNQSGTDVARVNSAGTFIATTVDINGGAIDGATVGATSASTGAFSTLTATTFGGITSANLVDKSATETITGKWTMNYLLPTLDAHLLLTADDTYDLGSSAKEFRDLYIDGTANIDSLVADTADINGGTIDGATVGANSASTGKFTTLQATSHLLYLSKVVNCNTDTAVVVANSGALYTNAGATTAVIYTLPAAVGGLRYLFSSVATDTTLDMTITAGAGDKINGGSAAGSYAATATEEKRACTIAAVDATNWRVISEVGTWANQ